MSPELNLDPSPWGLNANAMSSSIGSWSLGKVPAGKSCLSSPLCLFLQASILFLFFLFFLFSFFFFLALLFLMQ